MVAERGRVSRVLATPDKDECLLVEVDTGEFDCLLLEILDGDAIGKDDILMFNHDYTRRPFDIINASRPGHSKGRLSDELGYF